MNKNNTPVALTCGDLNSIAPLITLKAWLTLKDTPNVFFNISNAAYIKRVSDYFKLDIPISIINHPSDAIGVFKNSLPILDIDFSIGNFLGTPTVENASITLQSLDMAIDLANKKLVKAICTNPINKNLVNMHMQKNNFKSLFLGHTEYLANKTNIHNYIMILFAFGENLKVIPLTTHIPLKDVANSISMDLVYKGIINTHNALKNQFKINNPKIAVLALNPHCGDGGLMGEEENFIISPAINMAIQNGINCQGPIATDSAFSVENMKYYDAIIGMYHDQVLAPFKTLYFHQGVNITGNLPFIRTSPDHGVAYNIANGNLANETSLCNAIKTAYELST